MIKIKSKTDVITNSSDETYLIKSNLSENEFLELLKEHLNPEDMCSGMGGIIEVYSKNGCNDKAEYYYHDENTCSVLPEGYLEVCIDNGFTSLHKYIRELGGISEQDIKSPIIQISDIGYNISAILNLLEEYVKNYDIDSLKDNELYDYVISDKINKISELLDKFKK